MKMLELFTKAIQKWEKVSYHNSYDFGTSDCAFCKHYDGDDDCYFYCPLRDICGNEYQFYASLKTKYRKKKILSAIMKRRDEYFGV